MAAGPSGAAPTPGPAGPAVVDRGTVAHAEVRAGRWSVHGIAKVAGDVDAGVVELDGTVVVGGALTAQELSSRGSLEARGPCVVHGPLRAHGTFEAAGPVRAREARLEGSARVGGELVSEGDLRVRGRLHGSNVNCHGVLEIRGTATLPGTVVATSVEAALTGETALGVVRCRELRLRGPAPNLVQRVLGNAATATVERVEAETVVLENVRVRFVRAGHVELGRNAHVATVEGTVVRSHPTSRLGPESWSRPPAGLTR